MTYLKEEIKAGVIIFTALAILTASVVLLSGKKSNRKYDLYQIELSNVGGLESGAHVRLGGVKVGKVQNIITPETFNDKITVVFGVKKGIALFKGTKASISQIGFIGDIYLHLSLDNLTEEPHTPGDTLPSVNPFQFDQILSKFVTISERVNSLILKTEKLLDDSTVNNIDSILSNLNNTLVKGSDNLDTVSRALLEITGEVKKVLNDLGSLISENKGGIRSLISNAENAIGRVSEAIAAIEDTALASKQLIDSVEGTSFTIDKTSKSMKIAIDKHSHNLDTLFDELITATEQLNETLTELRKKPWRIIYKDDVTMKE